MWYSRSVSRATIERVLPLAANWWRRYTGQFVAGMLQSLSQCSCRRIAKERSQVKLEVRGRARREWKVNLGNRNSSRSNGSWRMTPKTVSPRTTWRMDLTSACTERALRAGQPTNMRAYNFFVCGPKFTIFASNDQLLFRFSICRSVPKIFAIKVESCQKSRRILDVFFAMSNLRRAFQK